MGKGFVEVFASTLINIVSIILFIAAIYYIFTFFVSYSETISLHEMDTKVTEFSENFLTNCSLLASPGIFDSKKLDPINNTLAEPCFRYCEYGIFVMIIDVKNNREWYFGYRGEQNENKRGAQYSIGIMNSSGDINNGNLYISISDDLVTRLSCYADRAYVSGNMMLLGVGKGKTDIDKNITITSVSAAGENKLCAKYPSPVFTGVYESTMPIQDIELCRRIYNATSVQRFDFTRDRDKVLGISKGGSGVVIGEVKV